MKLNHQANTAKAPVQRGHILIHVMMGVAVLGLMLASLYAAGSVVLGLAATWCGATLAEAL